jgi:tetratricopeptide (TPR) repeat protein
MGKFKTAKHYEQSQINLNMKKIGLLIVYISVTNCFSQTSEEFYKIGLEKYDWKDYNGSIIAFTKAIELTHFESDNQIRKKILEQLETKKQVANYFLKRGYSKFEIHDFESAEKDFWNVTMILPDFPEGHFQKGRAYFEFQEFSLSIFAFTETIEIDSSYAEAYFRRGLAKYELASPFSHKNEMLDDSLTHSGNYNDAISDFTKSLEIHCCPSEAYYRRGIAKGQLGDDQGAIDDQTKAIVMNPNYALAYQERGIAKQSLGFNQGAMDDFNISIKISPNARFYRCRGAVKLGLADFYGTI